MTKISSDSMAKLGNRENVTTDILLRIYKELNRNIPDIMETVNE